jgi:hypothetical protein
MSLEICLNNDIVKCVIEAVDDRVWHPMHISWYESSAFSTRGNLSIFNKSNVIRHRLLPFVREKLGEYDFSKGLCR